MKLVTLKPSETTGKVGSRSKLSKTRNHFERQNRFANSVYLAGLPTDNSHYFGWLNRYENSREDGFSGAFFS